VAKRDVSNKTKFVSKDETKLEYMNWDETNVNFDENIYIEMLSKNVFLANPTLGKWKQVSCKKKNGILCCWSISKLEKIVLQLKEEMAQKFK
jgi:hypothetical protein